MGRTAETVVVGVFVTALGLQQIPSPAHDNEDAKHPPHAPGNKIVFATPASTLQSGAQVFAAVTVDNTDLTRDSVSIKMVDGLVTFISIPVPEHPAVRR